MCSRSLDEEHNQSICGTLFCGKSTVDIELVQYDAGPTSLPSGTLPLCTSIGTITTSKEVCCARGFSKLIATRTEGGAYAVKSCHELVSKVVGANDAIA